MLVYKIKDKMFKKNGRSFVEDCYSGHDKYRNDPLYMNLKDFGPLPQGAYWIGEPFDHPKCGIYCLRLTPVTPGARMYDRSGFLIHGDSAAHPGEASDGCIVASHSGRVLIAESDERQLIVLADDY